MCRPPALFRGFSTPAFSALILSAVLVGPTVARADPLSDLCDSMQGVCRELNDSERTAYGASLVKLMAALPTPSAQKFQRTELRSLGQFGPLTVRGSGRELEQPPSTLVYPKAVAYRSGGSFPQAFGVVDSFARKDGSQVSTNFARVALLQPGEPPFDLRIEAEGLPVGFHAELEPGSKTFEKAKDLLAWETPRDGELEVVMVFGDRADSADEMEPTWAAPPVNVDGIAAVRVRILGPPDEARAMAKRINKARIRTLLTEKPRSVAAPALPETNSGEGTVRIQDVKRKPKHGSAE